MIYWLSIVFLGGFLALFLDMKCKIKFPPLYYCLGYIIGSLALAVSYLLK